VLAQDSQDATVDIGQRGAVGIRTTTRPDDTTPVSRSRARRRTQKKTSRQIGNGEHSASDKREATGRVRGRDSGARKHRESPTIEAVA
jgi:hypothetical protein